VGHAHAAVVDGRIAGQPGADITVQIVELVGLKRMSKGPAASMAARESR
jgi:hypothetical protein